MSTKDRSPINLVQPYDVLREIFVHCLPEHSSLDRIDQATTRLAPMLLCQVSSSWRMVALESPAFWCHLSYCFDKVEIYGESTWAISRKHIEFIGWWRRNHGSIAPFLTLSVRIRQRRHPFQEYLPPDDSLDIILSYISSAQYLNIDGFFWKQILERVNIGTQVTCPNLHTLVELGGCYQEGDDDLPYPFHPTLALIGHFPNHVPSDLRNLYIAERTLPDAIDVPPHWSTLTHISFRHVELSTSFWLTLIRTVQNLQRGYFLIGSMFGTTDHAQVTRCTLPHLNALFIEVHNASNVELPLSFLFTHLHLPALHSLSLSSLTRSWKDHRAITEIQTVLKSTPHVKTLFLRSPFLSFDNHRYNSVTLSKNDMDPVWSRATQLEHLKIELKFIHHRATAEAEAMWSNFVQNVFAPRIDGWLDLGHTSCPIRRITFIETGLWDWGRIKEFAASRLRDVAEQAANTCFEFSSELPNRITEVWMERDYTVGHEH